MLRSGLRNTTTFTKRAMYNAGHYHSILSQNSAHQFIKVFTINTSRHITSFQSRQSSTTANIFQIPEELLHTHHPKPVRHEILESKTPLKTKDLENFDVKVGLHREPVTWSDKLA